MKILVTGGAGFIGSHILEKLLEQDCELIVVDNFYTGNKSNIPDLKKIKVYNENILSDNLDKIFAFEKPDFCIHLAAQISVAQAMFNPYADAQVNILGSINVLQCCKKYCVKKFLTASTAAVYGVPQKLPIDENHSANPISYYGLSKLVMERYVQASGIDYVIFRLANVYGPRQNSKGEAGVISIFADKMINNEQITIEDDGEQTRDFVYVKDIAGAFANCINNDIKNEIINISTNSSISINHLFETMADIYDYKQKPIYAQKRKGDIKHSVLDNSKYLCIINNVKFTSLYEGLKMHYIYNQKK